MGFAQVAGLNFYFDAIESRFLATLNLNMADFVDQVGWAIQTQQRKVGESIEWAVRQWFERSPKAKPEPSADWSWLVTLIFWTLRGLGLVLIGLCIYLLGRFLWRWYMGLPDVAPGRTKRSEPKRSPLDWLGIAKAAQAEQDYRKAFQALYRALLLLLNEAGLLLHDAARTDRESIRRLDQLWSLSDQPIAVRDDWVVLFETHEALCFGGDDVSRDRFLKCMAAYDQLVPYLKPRVPS
jgi:Domain of unknown function (DUF4129)